MTAQSPSNCVEHGIPRFKAIIPNPMTNQYTQALNLHIATHAIAERCIALYNKHGWRNICYMIDSIRRNVSNQIDNISIYY